MKTSRSASSAWTSCALALALLSATTGRAQNVIAWGSGSQGQTNVPPSATNVVAVAAGALHSLALRLDSTVVGWGSGAGTNIPANVTNALAIAAGMTHGLALLADNSVVAWGDNTYGQTNVPAEATNVIALAAGYYHNLALRADGTVVAWGKNTYGQCSVPASLSNVVAITAGAEHSMALTSGDAVVIWGGSTSSPLSYAVNPPPRSLTDIVAISTAASHNLAIKPGGGAVSWGYTLDQPSIPSAATTNVVAVAAGTNYNLALSANGTVIAWGKGAVTNVPPSATNIVAVASGLAHGLAVKGDGSPRILGPLAYRSKVSVANPLPFYARAVGKGSLSYQWTSNGVPVAALNAALPQIPAVLGNDDVAYQVIVTNALGSATSTVARVAVRSINIWGDSTDDQCSIADSVMNPVSVAAGGFHSLALNADGTVAAWGKNWDGQTDVPPAATNVVAIAAGGSHSFALKSNGSVIAWGRDWDGQTDVPPAAINVIALAAGWAHSLALRADGTVVAWGNDDLGQTDVSFLAMNVVAIAAGYYHSIALRSDGMVATWGWDVPTPSNVTNVVAVAAGWGHCLALRADGSVVAWGDNTYGQTTVPTSATQVVAIAAGWYHNLALRADGTAIVWGKAASGVAAVPSALSNVASLAVGEDYCAALVGAGPPRFSLQPASIVAHAGAAAVLTANVAGLLPLTLQWYHNGAAVSGATNRFLFLTACQAADGGDYVLVATNAAGQASSQPVTLVVRPDPVTTSAVGAWGDGLSGQCNVSHAAVSPRAIAAGAFHALALNADGTVAAWGKNSDGQTNVPFMLPLGTRVVAIAAGGYHSLALQDDGWLIGWGRSQSLGPATPNIAAVAAGLAHSVALRNDGTVVAWGDNECGQTNVPAFSKPVIAIAAGYYHTLALLADRSVVAWGLENTVPAEATNVVAISAGWWHSLALRADGTVVAWGDNSYGQCSIPASAANVVGIAAGYAHSLALLADGTVLAWGSGFWGATNIPTGLGNVASIAAGQDYSLATVEFGPPRFVTPPASVAAHVGGQAILTAEVVGTHPLALQWNHDGGLMTGATNRWLVLTNVQLTDAGRYTLIATNGAGQTNSASAYLTILSGPAIAEALTPQNVLVGKLVCLPARVTGAEPLSCQWRLNGRTLADDTVVSGATSKTLCLAAARNEDSGTYSLVASNAYGCVTSTVAQVSVSPVLAWGNSSLGQTAVPFGTADVAMLAAGGDHSLALRANSAIAGWGDNSSGQSNVPQPAGAVVAVADGEAYSLALRADGTVIAWGDNTYGQTAVPASATNVVAIAAGRSHSLALRLDGTAVAWGTNAFGRVTVPASATNVVAIGAGDDFDLALQANGTLVQWGGLLPAPAEATNVVAIAAGAKHALALRADGALIAWGASYYGQTTVPDSATKVVGIAAGGDHSLALLADGTVICWGANYFGQASVPPSAMNISAISAGGAHSLALAGSGAPRPAFQPFQRAVTIGQPTVFNGGTLNGAAAEYQWQLNGIDVPGANSPTLSLGFITWTNAGLYRVVMSNALGVVVGPPIMLTVLRTLLRFDSSPQGIQMTDDGAHLRLLGAAGVGPVVLLASGNLGAWEPILTNPPVIGSVQFVDAGAGSQPGRFYRAVEGAVAGPLRIELAVSPSPAGNGAIPLRVTGLAAEGPVVIYASSNLLDWGAIFTNPPTIGPLQYMETPVGVQRRFYRACENR